MAFSFFGILKGLSIQNEVDRTKQVIIQSSSAATTNTSTTITSAQTANRTQVLPDASGNIVVDSATQTFTNKTIDANSNTILNISGGSLGTNSVPNATLAQMPANTIKSNITGSTANAADNTLSAIIDSSIASTQGDILYRNSSAWVALPPGTNGQVLTTAGAAANPSWQNQTGTGGANDTLSNLTPPTAINQNLSFDSALSSPSLLTIAKSGTTQTLTLNTGASTTSTSGVLTLSTGNTAASGQSAGNVNITPGHNTGFSGPNGNINITATNNDTGSGKLNVDVTQVNFTTNNGFIVNAGVPTFQNGTTGATVQVIGGSGSGSGGKLLLGGVSGSSTQIRAPDSGYASPWTWPSSPGTSGYVLTSDGSGGLNFSTPGVANYQISTSSGSFTTTSTSFTAVTNLSVTITTTGRPVIIQLIPDGNTSTGSYVRYDFGSGTNPGAMQFLRDASAINQFEVGMQTASVLTYLSPSSYMFFEVPGAGTYTYTVQVRVTSGGSGTFDVVNAKLLAYEI